MTPRHGPRVEVRPCPVKVALRFNLATHRRLPALQGGMWAVAAVIGSETVGVAIVGHPQARLTPMVVTVHEPDMHGRIRKAIAKARVPS